MTKGGAGDNFTSNKELCAYCSGKEYVLWQETQERHLVIQLPRTPARRPVRHALPARAITTMFWASACWCPFLLFSRRQDSPQPARPCRPYASCLGLLLLFWSACSGKGRSKSLLSARTDIQGGFALEESGAALLYMGAPGAGSRGRPKISFVNIL